jgi:hypothetical protein
MLNINEDELKAAIVKNAADQILDNDSDLSALVAEEVSKRMDKIFADRAEVQIQAAIDEAIARGFDREYQRVTSYGEAIGQKTTIRSEMEKIINGYWSQRVEVKTGKPPTTSDYNTCTRAEYLMTVICADNFSEKMKQSALNIAGNLKDGLRWQMASVMDNILNELFRVKSLQDQGKVEKPY